MTVWFEYLYFAVLFIYIILFQGHWFKWAVLRFRSWAFEFYELMEEIGDSRVQPPRVRIRECDEGLQKLFNRDLSRATKPMDARNFPRSFWIPPTDEHPRRSELMQEQGQEGLGISHRKSNSSPSAIGTNPAYLLEPGDHNRQKSLDAAHSALQHPKGGQMSSSVDYSSQIMQMYGLNLNHSGFSRPCPGRRHPGTLTSPICELPPGFQMAINDKNQVYFLNHDTKQTSW